MSNLLLASPDIGDAASVTGSSVAGGLPLKNLKTMPIGMPARFMTPVAAHILVDLGASPLGVNLIGLLGHNASATGTARVRASDIEGDVTASPSYDSGELRLRSNIAAPLYQDVGSLKRNHFILKLPENKTYRYWRIDMADANITYLDVGRLYISNAFQPVVNMDYGLQEGFIDPSTMQRTVSGRVSPNERIKRRFAEFSLSFLDKSEVFGPLFDLEASRGSTRDVLFIADHDDKPYLQKRSIYGMMSSLNPAAHEYWNIFGKVYRIEEIVE